MTQTPAVRFSCAWVPATLDRVRVSSPYGTFEVDLQLVRQVLGRPALQALYLQGRYNVEKPELTLRAILDQLGIELAPQTIAPGRPRPVRPRVRPAFKPSMTQAHLALQKRI